MLRLWSLSPQWWWLPLSPFPSKSFWSRKLSRGSLKSTLTWLGKSRCLSSSICKNAISSGTPSSWGYSVKMPSKILTCSDGTWYWGNKRFSKPSRERRIHHLSRISIRRDARSFTSILFTTTWLGALRPASLSKHPWLTMTTPVRSWIKSSRGKEEKNASMTTHLLPISVKLWSGFTKFIWSNSPRKSPLPAPWSKSIQSAV